MWLMTRKNSFERCAGIWPLKYNMDMHTNARIMSYPKCWNWRRILKLSSIWIIVCFLIFSWKKIRYKRIQIILIELWCFISFKLMHLNSLKVPQNAKFSCIFFFSWKFNKKNQYSTPISTHRTLHDMGKSVVIHIVFANYFNDTFSLPENMLEHYKSIRSVHLGWS